MNERKPFCSVLHLSDTHLGAHFEDAGGPGRKFLKAVIADKSYVMQAHDLNLLLLLPLQLGSVARLNRAQFAKAWPEQEPPAFFDRVIVSGDISTDATDESRFKFAHGFLTSEMPLQSGGIYANQAGIGLKIPNELLITLPGNHDKMRETTLDRFNRAFGKSPAAANYVRAFRRNGKTVIFFVLDSNAYNEGNIARGEIDLARRGWLAKELNKLNSGMVIGDESFNAEECGEAIKCLVLHHHVCDLSWKRRHFSLGRKFVALDGADELLDLITGRVHMIVHGHEHYPTHFIEKTSGALLISAGTTSQWQESHHKNSFYHLTIFTDNTVQIEEYVWEGVRFVTREQLKGESQPPHYQLPVLN
jgi:3',5'-cyclic AMP phosphodiesterase CpdA